METPGPFMLSLTGHTVGSQVFCAPGLSPDSLPTLPLQMLKGPSQKNRCSEWPLHTQPLWKQPDRSQ